MRSNLLPNSFKLLGVAIFTLAFVVPIVMGMMHTQPWEETETRRHVAQTLMMVGVLIFILSKDKIEDEFVNACRLKAFKVAFIAGFVYFLQDAFGTYKGALMNSSFYLLMMQSLVYCVVFYIQKAGWTNGK